MLSCLVPSSSSSSRFGQEDNILIKQSMPSSPAFSVQFPPLANSLHLPHHHQQSDPKNTSDNISIDNNADDENRSSPIGRNECAVIDSPDTSDFIVLCPLCAMRFNNSEAFRDHIVAVHPNDKLNLENIESKHKKVNSEPPQTDEDDSNQSSSSSQLTRKYNKSNNNNNSSLKNNNNSIVNNNNEDEDSCTPHLPAASTTPSSSAHQSPNPLAHNGLAPLAGDLSTSAFAAAAAAYAESTLHHHQHSHLHSHANAMTPHRNLHSTTAAQLMAALAASTLSNGHHPGLHHLQQQHQQQTSLLASDIDGTRSASSPSSTIGENVPPYGCLQCTAFFPTREQLDKHEALHSPNAQAQGQGVTQSCKICHKTFANVYRLQRHMISHDESALLRKFKCNQCDKAFKFKHHLKEHVRIHSGEKPFGCDNCGKRFSHSGSFSSHMTSKKCISMGLKLNNNRAMLKNIERSTSDTSSSIMGNSPKRVSKLANGLQSTDSGSTGVLPNPINYFASDAATNMGGSPTSTATSSPFYPNYNAMNAALLASFPHPFYSMALDPRMHPYNIQRLLELTAAGQHQQQQEQEHQKHRDDEETPDDPKLVMDLGESTRLSRMDLNSDCKETNNRKINETLEDDEDNDTESVSNKPKECLEYSIVRSPKVVVSHNEELEVAHSKILSKDSSKDYLRDLPQDVALEVQVKQEPLHTPSPAPHPQTESDEEHAAKVNQSQKFEDTSTSLKDHETSNRCEIVDDSDDSSVLRCRRCDKRFNHPTELVQHEKVLCGYIKQELQQRFQQQLLQKPQQQKHIGDISFESAANSSFLQSSDAEEDHDSSSRNECGSESGERKVRVRTAITEEQQQQLKEHYLLNARPSRDEFRLIATRLQLDARVVQVWFQNNRSRERKMQCYQNNNNNTYNKIEPKKSLESSRDSPLNPSGSNANEELPLDLSVKRDFTTKLNGHARQHSPLYGMAPLQISGFAEAINLSRKMSSSSLSPSSLSPSSATSVPHGFKHLSAGTASASEVHYFGAPPPPPLQPHTFHLSPSHSTKDAGASTTSNTMPTSSITQTSHGAQNCGSSFSTLPPYILASAVQRQLVPMPMDALFPMSPVAAAAAEYARQNPALINSIKLRAAAGASGLPEYRGTSLSPGGSEKRSWRDDDSRVSHEDDFQGNSLGGLMPPKPKRLKAETHGHAGDPDLPFVCDQCDKAFAKQSSLARHKYEHSGQRPYQCVDCPKAFKHKHHLTEHKRLHSGEKPFQCSKCLKRFSHSGSYSQHMNHRYSYCKPYRE